MSSVLAILIGLLSYQAHARVAAKPEVGEVILDGHMISLDHGMIDYNRAKVRVSFRLPGTIEDFHFHTAAFTPSETIAIKARLQSVISTALYKNEKIKVTFNPDGVVTDISMQTIAPETIVRLQKELEACKAQIAGRSALNESVTKPLPAPFPALDALKTIPQSSYPGAR
jgi:hypothetical protein